MSEETDGERDSSYVDYDAFLSEDFSASAFANSLVLTTNNPSDHPLDLNTPLSRVLFDIQEVDTHIDNLTRKSALPLLEYTKSHVESANRILQELETQVATLTEGYERLERDILARYDVAEQTRIAVGRLWHTVRLCRQVARILTLGRQLDVQMAELRTQTKREDHKAMVRATNSILSIRQVAREYRRTGEEQALDRVAVVRMMRTELVDEAEKTVIQRAEQAISSFSMASLATAGAELGEPSARSATYAEMEDARSLATASLLTLYLLSANNEKPEAFVPTRLITALQEYLRRGITASVASLAGALASLPKLDRTLAEISARCQNVAAMEILLGSIKRPAHPSLMDAELSSTTGMKTTEALLHARQTTLLDPLLNSLDTSSLPSYFWRSMASQLSSRVQRIIKDGGAASRSLRSNRDRLRDAIRECVDRGSQVPASSLSRGKPTSVHNWEREAAVMVSSITGLLGK